MRSLLERQPEPVTSALMPSSTGFYAWWDLDGAVPYPESFPDVDTAKPFYVGIADAQPLSLLIGQMHLETTRMSTLRRSLAALLADELSLADEVTARPKGKYALTDAGEAGLTAWMLDRLTLTWAEHPTPATLERSIVSSLLPPLNDVFAHAGPYWRAMRTIRAVFRAHAL